MTNMDTYWNDFDENREYVGPLCGVCGAPATGYNFDQITCQSCKIFFRRNALRDMSNLRCRYEGACVIDARTRRQCAYCRLKKCFDINMRKDWIRTEEEIEMRKLYKLAKEQRRENRLANDEQQFFNLPLIRRRKKRLKTRQTTQDIVPISVYRNSLFHFNHNLSDEDLTSLNNVTNAYQFIDEQAEHLRRRQWTPLSSIVEFINRETEVHKLLINFFKLIPGFRELDIEDRVLLIKSNLLKMVPLHCVLIYRFQENPKIGEHMSKWISLDFHQRMSRTVKRHNRFIELPLVLKLSLIIFIFSTNLSAPFGIDSINNYSNTRHIREIQDYYITILWRYLATFYDESEVVRLIDMITAQILNYQILMNEMEGVICQHPDRNTFNELEFSLHRLTL